MYQCSVFEAVPAVTEDAAAAEESKGPLEVCVHGCEVKR